MLYFLLPRYICQLHFLIVCFIKAHYLNRTVIFKDIDPIRDGRASGHIKITPDLNRFADSFLPFSNCNDIDPNTIDIVNGNYT